MSNSTALDEIGRTVDRIIKDKDRAARLKVALHQQYELTRPDNQRRMAHHSAYVDDAEDLWDNVPV